MKLDEILSAAGKKRPRRRIGRGVGSGHGKTAGRGHKGSGSRAGSKRLYGNEGGQNPIIARMPKRGFNNAQFRKDFQIVNVAALQRFDDGSEVDVAALATARLVDAGGDPVKILGQGELTKKLTVVAAKFSASAKEKIEKAGGAARTPGDQAEG